MNDGFIQLDFYILNGSLDLRQLKRYKDDYTKFH